MELSAAWHAISTGLLPPAALGLVGDLGGQQRGLAGGGAEPACSGGGFAVGGPLGANGGLTKTPQDFDVGAS